MKLSEMFMCAGYILLATTAHAGIVPSKASLSLKDKLALDIPVKQLITDKTGEKSETVKVGFPVTPSTTTTTTVANESNKPQRPKYVDATVFRHQFTTPSTSSSTSFSPVDDPNAMIPFFTSHGHNQESFGLPGGELGLVTDRKTESFKQGFAPTSFRSAALESDGSSLTAPSTTTTARTITTTKTTTSTIASSTTTATAPSTTATAASPPEDFEFSDYEAHFRLMDDLGPFGGELGILGGDRRGESYVNGFRPLGF